jgi:hypothetical protein
MNQLLLFGLEIIISLCLSTVTLWLLSQPLVNVLEDLCPTKKQAAFWLAYTRIMLLISPLLLVLVVSILNNAGNNIDTIKISLGSALAGLLLGMIIVGRKIFEPVNKQCVPE